MHDKVYTVLLERMARGDETALAALYHLTVEAVYAAAHGALCSQGVASPADEARDVVHWLYLHVWRNAATLDPGAGSAQGLSALAAVQAADRRLGRGTAR